ncbi:MAG TPA: type II/IV secretion system ATPase subunit, partial [Candidatus Thermoplasmatota archaeon]|nr:type II/IV secretion system ATPase subunit [Candidatus Thermoplasmatota archaeon]
AEAPKRRSWWSKFTSKLSGDAAPEQQTPVTVVPPITEEGVREVEVYPVQEPYAYIRISYNEKSHEHLYEVIEPQMSDREQKVLEFVETTLVDVIEVGLSALEAGGAEEALRKHVDEILYDYSITLNPKAREKLLYYIIRDFLGNGKMEPVMRDEQIEDISCDGPQVPLFLYHRKYESVKSTVRFPSHQELDSFVIRLAQRSGKHISIAEPLLDATMPDGSRLNATLSDEVTSNGSTFTIRKFRPDPFTPPDLVRFGTMSADMLAYWWLAVQHGASAIYAGGTASGKTTSLNAILLFIPPQMKIVSIEDTREINLPHPNWIAGVTRSGFGPRDNNGRQAGEIDMFTLLKAALRQRPEYILVGEVRGQEAYALFQAMATGHTAYGTMHADSVESVIHRLESDPISIPRSLLESLDIVSIQIQTRIGNKRVRRTKELVEIVGLDPHTRELLTNEVFNWNSSNDTFEFSGVSYVLERIQMEKNMTEAEMREELLRRKDIIHWLIKKGHRDYKTVGHIIASYYKEPTKTVAEARKELAEMAAKEAAEAAAAAAASPEGAPAGTAAEGLLVTGPGGAVIEATPPALPDDPFAAMREAIMTDGRDEEDEAPGA